jgi:hypothetical protein
LRCEITDEQDIMFAKSLGNKMHYNIGVQDDDQNVSTLDVLTGDLDKDLQNRLNTESKDVTTKQNLFFLMFSVKRLFKKISFLKT